GGLQQVRHRLRPRRRQGRRLHGPRQGERPEAGRRRRAVLVEAMTWRSAMRTLGFTVIVLSCLAGCSRRSAEPGAAESTPIERELVAVDPVIKPLMTGPPVAPTPRLRRVGPGKRVIGGIV